MKLSQRKPRGHHPVGHAKLGFSTCYFVGFNEHHAGVPHPSVAHFFGDPTEHGRFADEHTVSALLWIKIASNIRVTGEG